MPFYEYQCKSCGHALEAMQKISEPPLKKCPECGRSQLQRLMSAPVFRLKGGGWYETDFKSDQDNKRNLADKPEADAPKEATDIKAKDAAGDTTPKPAEGAGDKSDKGDKADKGEKSNKGDKPADKRVEKPAESTKKTVGGGLSRRGAASGPLKSAVKARPKKTVKKPAAARKRAR